ncbi:uncharacterized protein BXZ73DRAFT_53579 [Epithele typhae]|uniref:uncharacterized protein n=1 Tax=Epithele typhae TaxID=378194 RepID=UPI002007BB1E|nr:uncharacterized protein BXZ73DRAFT_53579 [Epithele typhae]KAH9916735.1 hypothetical protein BXZ73DRAFT_53579 [Epithele typhae]
MSYAEWKREPTLMQVLFGLHLPYRPPRSFIGKFFWRRRVWVEVTFALSMMEPWEKAVVLVVTYLTLGLLFTGIFFYLPHHLVFINERAAYYLFGRDDGQGAASDLADSFGRLRDVASWGLDTSLGALSKMGAKAEL